MRDQIFPSDDDRYLVLDHTDEDMPQILTVICDRGFRPSLIENDRGGMS